MAWIEAYPLSSTGVSASCTQIQANWAAIETILGIEHYTFTDAATSQGLHKAGYVGAFGIMSASPYTLASVPSSSESGGVIISGTTGEAFVWVYDSEGNGTWERFGAYQTRVKVSKYSKTYFAPSLATKCTFATYSSSGNFDPMSAVINSVFTAPISGYYLIRGTVNLSSDPVTGTEYAKRLYIRKGATTYITGYKTYGSHVRTLEVYDIVRLVDNDVIDLVFYHTNTDMITATYCSLEIVRI